MVYVIDQSGNPLMPTTRHAKVRKMLKDGRAVVKTRTPFTIQLKYEPETHVTQELHMGIDIGQESCGVSVVRYPERDLSSVENRDKPLEGTEVFVAEIVPRKDLSVVQKQRRELRQSRRKRNGRRKKHHIKKNEKRKKAEVNTVTKKGIFNEIIESIIRIMVLLPINNIIIEDGEFMSQMTKTESFNTDINGEYAYQAFTRMKPYQRTSVLIRDNHVCQCCFGRSKEKILTTKNIIGYYDSEKDRKNDTKKLGPYLTLCLTCRKKIEYLWKAHKKDRNNPKKRERYYTTIKKMRTRHEGFVLKHHTRETMEDRRDGKVYSPYSGVKHYSFKEEIRRYLHDLYDSKYRKYAGVVRVRTIDGITIRIARRMFGFSNTPINNARVSAMINYKVPTQASETYYYRYRKYRSRSLHKVTPKKGGIRPPRSPMIVKGFSAYDEVRYLGKKHPELYEKTFFITKKRKTGYFSIGRLDGTTILNSVKYSDLKLITKRKAYSVERR